MEPGAEVEPADGGWIRVAEDGRLRPAHQGRTGGRGVWGESTDGLIRKAAEQRANKLTHAEFEREATWATRKFVPFVMQRIVAATQSQIRQALGRGMGPDSA